MTDDALRALWRSNHPTDKETLVRAMETVLEEDRAARNKDRWIRITSVSVLALLCPLSLWCAVYGKTALVRGGYALMGAGIAGMVVAELLYLAWSRQARPGPADTRSQLQTTSLLLSRQANVFKMGFLWCAPVFLGVVLIGLWIYQERSHAQGYLLWAITAIGWVMAFAGGIARGKKIDERRSRMERMLGELGE